MAHASTANSAFVSSLTGMENMCLDSVAAATCSCMLMCCGNLVAGVCLDPAALRCLAVAIGVPILLLMAYVSGVPRLLPGCASAVQALQWLIFVQSTSFNFVLAFLHMPAGKNFSGNMLAVSCIMHSALVE